MADHYKLRGRTKHKTRRRFIRLAIVSVVLIILIIAGMHSTVAVKHQLEPHTAIRQSPAVKSTITYENKTTSYSQPDFTIELPVAWKPVPRPVGPYQTFTWRTSDSGTDGQEFTIYQDTIPANFAVNRVLVLEGQSDHVQMSGNLSENCITFTNGLGGGSGQTGVPAKWQGISFLCDRSNTTRDVIGTSSADGVNTVTLRTSAGVAHKYFFTYSNHSLNPDYSLFQNALRSVKMK